MKALTFALRSFGRELRSGEVLVLLAAVGLAVAALTAVDGGATVRAMAAKLPAVVYRELLRLREELKAELAAKMTRLVEMRALCTRMLRNTLTEEQFAKVVAAYRAGIDS